MQDKEFSEKQQFTQLWLWCLLIASFLLPCLIPVLSNDDVKFLNNDSRIVLILGLVFCLFFYLLELRVFVNSQGIHYQFFPLHLKSYIIKYDEIERVEAVTYSPIMDYGGWGIRFRYKAKAYNVKGKEGVKVYLKNGRHILFGSQRNTSFANAIIGFMKP